MCKRSIFISCNGRVAKLKNTLYIVPLLLMIAVFIIYPAANMIIGSFFKTKLNGDVIFNGLSNYKNILSRDYFIQIVGNTLLWVIATVILKNAVGLALALVLNKEFKSKKIFMILAILPWANPWIIDSIIFRWIFDGLYGYINSILFNLHLIQRPIDIMGSEIFAIWSVICCNVWAGISFVGFTYLAELYSIPDYMYEAASLDGASKWQQFKCVTLPLILPAIELMSLLTTLWGLNSFDMIYTMTGGGPMYASETLVTHIYRLAFVANNPGQANALSVITFIAMTALSIVYINKGKKGDQYV